MMKKAEKEIDESADNPKESAETAQKVANISKKVKEIEERLGEGAKSLRDSANVLTSKTAEILEQNIQNTNQEIKNMVADEINEYETKTLNNPQLELFNQAKKYYNNNQFELALEKLFEIK
jgi:ABC-type Fe3+-citrate transport system substrate-binding protein